jgi:type VI secretion system protein ImpG
MTNDDKLYQAYLEELQQIEKFRSSHVALYGETPIESEDPHTKRLIESLAFFSARAHLQGTRKMVQIHQCLFRQYFPYLVQALPAFAMLQLKPSLKYPEKVVFAPGAELVFKTVNNLKATFQTLDSLTVFPFLNKSFEFTRRGKEGWRCTVEFTTTHISTEEIGTFRLYINHLNSFLSSLSVSFAMQYALESVQVFYDDERAKQDKGKICSISFGYDSQERKVFDHVIEQIRSLLHFPQQELFINLQVPPCGKRWQSFTLCFDFNEKWPDSLKLNSDSFLPYVVPIVNLKKAFAEPVVDDGTKDSFPVLFPEPMHKFELHTVTNVSEILSTGTRPIIPGLLGLDEGGSYEVDYFNKEIILNLPNAFSDPKTVSIHALWTQPWFSNYVDDELDLQFSEAQSFGLSVRLLGAIHRYENTLEDDPNFLIRILSLKNRTRLTPNEILFIMNVMKNLNNSFFDSIPPLIRDLKINEKFQNKQMTALVEYEFFLKDLGGQKWELAVLFFKYLNDLLNSWLSNFEVETKVHFTKMKKPIIFKRGSNHELSVLARDLFFS